MGSHVTRPIHEVAKALGQVVLRQVLDQTLSVAGEPVGEGDLLSQRHLEHLVGVVVHEGRAPHHQLIDEDAKSVPVSCASVAHIQDNLRRDVLWGAAEGVSAIPGLQPLYKAKVSQLHVTIVLKQYVLGLEVPIDEVLPVHILKHEDDLGTVELDHVRSHSAQSLDHVEQLAVLHVLHQNVKVAAVLSHAFHLTQESVVHLRHVLDFVKEVLLLLRLKYLVLGDDLDSEHCLTLAMRSQRRHALEGLRLL